MKVSKEAIALIRLHEGLYSAERNKLVRITKTNQLVYPYTDPTGTATIGYGNTRYQDGTKVTLQDPPISQIQADNLNMWAVRQFSVHVADLIKVKLNDNQFGALVSLAYNIGIGNFKTSTLLKEVNKDPDNFEVIEANFNKWVNSKGKKLMGLVKRRQAEADFYKKKSTINILNFENMKEFFITHKKKIIIGGVVAVVVGLIVWVVKRKK